jgi:hypothetical protein
VEAKGAISDLVEDEITLSWFVGKSHRVKTKKHKKHCDDS